MLGPPAGLVHRLSIAHSVPSPECRRRATGCTRPQVCTSSISVRCNDERLLTSC